MSDDLDAALDKLTNEAISKAWRYWLFHNDQKRFVREVRLAFNHQVAQPVAPSGAEPPLTQAEVDAIFAQRGALDTIPLSPAALAYVAGGVPEFDYADFDCRR